MSKVKFFHIRADKEYHKEVGQLVKKANKINPLVENISDFFRYLVEEFKKKNK